MSASAPAALNVATPDTLDLLLSRRSGSAKMMKGPGPNDEQIATLIRCASRVPDHGKLAPWRYIVFKNDAREKFGELLARTIKEVEPDVDDDRIAQERRRFLRAPVVIGVVSHVREGIAIPEWEQILSAGASCQTLCIAAHSIGFVANWITEWYAYQPTVQAALGLKAGERIAGFIYLGHPQEPLVDRPRPELSKIVSEWQAPLG
jgi:nitroreductase